MQQLSPSLPLTACTIAITLMQEPHTCTSPGFHHPVLCLHPTIHASTAIVWLQWSVDPMVTGSANGLSIACVMLQVQLMTLSAMLIVLHGSQLPELLQQVSVLLEPYPLSCLSW